MAAPLGPSRESINARATTYELNHASGRGSASHLRVRRGRQMHTAVLDNISTCQTPTIACAPSRRRTRDRSEEHTSELQSLMRISYAVFCLKKKNKKDRGQ